jgi:5,10-methylenetetrahydrofolate reductase
MNNQPKTSFSYEFFPPRSVQMQRRLWRAIGQLERLRPSFFSMTYGALGSAQNVSIDTAIAMYRDSPVEVAAHLTCCNASRQQVDAVAWFTMPVFGASSRCAVTIMGRKWDRRVVTHRWWI